MITLALESAAAVASVALTEDGRTLAELTLDNGNTHSETLLPMADMLFRLTGRTLADVDLFAVSVGPGSFTGIRIGIATMKGFALAAGKKILPVTTFGCAAYNGKGKKILCLCDALHAHYYACGYNEAGEVTLPPSYIPEEELRALAAQGYELRTLENTDFLPADLPCVRIDPAKALAAEAEKLAENEEDFKEPAALYIRKCQAEIEKDERAAKQLADGDAGAEK